MRKQESTGTSSAGAAAHASGEEAPCKGRSGFHNRRKSLDRRASPTSIWSSLLGMSRRREGRRADERDGIYVDRFQRSDVVLVLAVFTLNIMDAGFTMSWLQRGGSEGNPLMAQLLAWGDAAFLIEKCFVVGVWLLILLVHKNFRVARIGLRVLLLVYGTLFVYHIALVASGVDPRDGPVAITITLGSTKLTLPHLRTEAASEEARQESWNRGLDSQAAGAQAQALQPRIGKPPELMVRPAVLGPDGKHYIAFDSARTVDGGARMRDESVRTGDQGW